MTKDEMKDRISMALKDPMLQQGFEIICKNLVELEKKNAGLEEQVSAMSKALVLNTSENDKQLAKAKDLLNEFMRISKVIDEDFEHDYSELIGETEIFLKEVEK